MFSRQIIDESYNSSVQSQAATRFARRGQCTPNKCRYLTCARSLSQRWALPSPTALPFIAPSARLVLWDAGVVPALVKTHAALIGAHSTAIFRPDCGCAHHERRAASVLLRAFASRGLSRSTPTARRFGDPDTRADQQGLQGDRDHHLHGTVVDDDGFDAAASQARNADMTNATSSAGGLVDALQRTAYVVDATCRSARRDLPRQRRPLPKLVGGCSRRSTSSSADEAPLSLWLRGARAAELGVGRG